MLKKTTTKVKASTEAPATPPPTRFDSEQMDDLRNDFEEIFVAMEKAYGMKLKMGTFSYNATEFNVRLTGTLVNKEAKKIAATNNERYSTMLGFNKNIVGELATSKYGRLRVKVIELAVNRPKYPIIGERLDNGKRYKFTEEQLTFDNKTIKYM